MGVVYGAEQISLGRKVALKVLPFAATLDAKHLQRFKNEAHAAAHLHHQNIVPVYAVGCERGVHYYAMQFIEGQTLAALISELRQFSGRERHEPGVPAAPATEVGRELRAGNWAPPKPASMGLPPTVPYRPARELTTPPPLDSTAPEGALSTEDSTQTPAFFRTVARLGIQAAQALEHAHGMGVIHRDIKPGNVLVDVRGNLWITDFGLAQVQGDAKLTMSGDLLGTIRYMSPEQALAKRIVVDHRTDIYSLGATLYELLTLEPVFRGQDRQEVLRQIAFEEPRPPRRLNPNAPAELATIVMKALAKNPAERYATAQELADDLGRYLRDEPIKAKAPTLAQRARKWARRRQEVVWTAGIGTAVLTVALVGVLTYSTLKVNRKNAELNSTNAELEKRNIQIHQQNDEIAKERDAATKAAAKAEVINKFLTVDLLGEAEPEKNARDKKITVEELLGRAAAKIEKNKAMAEQPEVQAELRDAIGMTYYRLGMPRSALEHLEKALELRRAAFGPDHVTTLAAQEHLADFMNLGLRRWDKAEPLSYQTWQARRRVLGPDHPDTLDSLDTYATALSGMNRLDEAEARMRECWEGKRRTLGETHPLTLTSLNNLSNIVANQGKWTESEQFGRQCLAAYRQTGGLGKSGALSSLNNLCKALFLLGKFAEAESLLAEGLESIRKTHGPEHQYTAHLEYMLSQVLLDDGKLDDAESHGRHGLTVRRRVTRVDSEDIPRSLLVLGRILLEKGKSREAEESLAESARLFQEYYQIRPDIIAIANCWHGASLAQLKRYDEAESLLIGSFDRYRKDLGVPARHKEKIRQHVIKLYEAWGKTDKAAEWRASGEIK
jgi:serine/threonine protein kinase/TolA-binding protein